MNINVLLCGFKVFSLEGPDGLRLFILFGVRVPFSRFARAYGEGKKGTMVGYNTSYSVNFKYPA